MARIEAVSVANAVMETGPEVGGSSSAFGGGTSMAAATTNSTPCAANSQKAPRQNPAWANSPPTSGLINEATPQTPARALSTRDQRP